MLNRMIRSKFFIAVFALAPLLSCKRSPQAMEARYMKRGQALLAMKDYGRALLEFRNAAQAMPKDAEPLYQIGIAWMAAGSGDDALIALVKAGELAPARTDIQIKLAELLTASRRKNLVEQARIKLQSILKTAPDDQEANDTLAKADLLLGNTEDAANRLEEELKKYPKDLQSTIELARLKLRQHDVKSAEALFKKAVESAPESSEAAASFGQFYMITGDSPKAEQYIKKALAINPKNASALLSLGAIEIVGNRMEEADRTYKRISELGGKYSQLHGVFLYQSGKLDAALAEFQRQFRDAPGDRVARTRVFLTNIAMKRFADADKILTDALKRNPRDTEALMERSALKLQRGKVEEAKADLNQLLSLNRNSAMVHFRLALVAGQEGLAMTEEQQLNETLRLNAGFLPARLALARTYLARNQAREALELVGHAPSDQAKRPQTIIERNWALLALGRTQDLRNSLDSALQGGRSPELVLQDALLRLQQRDYEGSRVEGEELMKNNPGNARAAYLVVETYSKQKQLPKGIAWLRAVAAANPKVPALEHVLGQWYMQTDNRSEARRSFEAAVGVDSRYLPSLLALADNDVLDGQLDSARQRLKVALGMEAKNVSALLMLVGVEERSGNRAAAIENCQSILQIDSSNLVALNNIAYDMAFENPDQALQFAQRAVEVAPKNPTVQDTLGWVYYRKGMYGEAAQQIKSAMSTQASPQFQFHLGMCYLKLGERQLGETSVRAALAKDSSLVKSQAGWY